MKTTVKRYLILAILVILASTTSVIAAEIPKLLKDGFDLYLKEGPKAAIEVWTKGGAMDGSKDALSQANNFRQVQDFYGNFIDYNVVKVKELSGSSSAYLIEMKYEKGNLFSKFFTYKKPDGKIVINTFNFHTNPETVWPSSVVFGCEEK
jgi:hypothetical protein